MRIHSIATLTFKCICFIPGLSKSQRRCLAMEKPGHMTRVKKKIVVSLGPSLNLEILESLNDKEFTQERAK